MDGGDADLWVLGDLVDRGPDGIGVIRFVRALQDQAPDRVQVLMGNHEALMLGDKLFPDTRFAEVWQLNGGQRRRPGGPDRRRRRLAARAARGWPGSATTC